ncbi:copper chaperone PCu(A)C [Leptospira perdikensis]|uniref:Copper chaperone PCu(A)C n=1 Tax=Leptospira perdikensis TaxID=2484948 RepID=A0A4R9JKI7_9LEPT|nr:copper chaperone PCu(A)C [Leptospira perdikensis]TGL44584.1 copper chaperone PCu(A)C [Leptospira perdikensis]
MKLKTLILLFLITTPLFSKGIIIENAYIKYTSSKNSVVYFSIHNTTNTEKKIIQTKSDIADRVELFTMKPSDSGMKMIPVEEFSIPKNSSLHLSPRGDHIMLFGIKSPLKLKESIPFRFIFSDGSEIQKDIPVENERPNNELNKKLELSEKNNKEIRNKNNVIDESKEDVMSNYDQNIPTNEDHSEHNHEGHDHHNRADTLAPAGIMNPHIHEKGKWMVDYRYMGMKMWGLQSGGKSQSDLGTLYFPYTDPTVQMPSGSLITSSPLGTTIPILSPNKYNYMSVPADMVMEMNMVSAMTSISDKWMIMFMVPAIKNKMTMVSSNFDRAPMSSAGIGDVSFSTAYRLIKTEHQNFFTGMGLSLPTGSIDERDNMPMMGVQKVPYNMQPGSGTYSLLPQLSYNGNYKKISWGAQSQANLRIGKNDNHYRFGNRYEVSGWLSFLIHESMSFSVRVAKQRWLNLQGADATLDPKMDPQNDPYRQGGMRSDLLIGVNFLITKGILQGARFGFEYGKPFHQNLNGPQLGTRELVNVFASFTF